MIDSAAIPRRTILKGAAVLGGTAMLSACGAVSSPSVSSSHAIKVTDQRGKVLTFDKPVTRVVTIPMPAAAVLLAADRTADHLVGMQNASWTAMRDGIMGTIFPKTLVIPHNVATAEFAPNVESILSLKPDVVIQWANQGVGLIDPLESAGLKVLGVNYGTLQDVDTWLSMFSTMLGKAAHARQVISHIDTTKSEIQAAAPQVSSGSPRILYFNRFVGGLKVAGNKTFNDEYIRLIGCTNPAAGTGGAPGAGMVAVGVEQVLAWDPDIIVLGNFDAAMPSDIYSNKVWKGISAVRSRRVYKAPLGGYRWDPPSQESPLMWRWLSSLAFPAAGKSRLRAEIVDTFRQLYDYTPSDTQIGVMLWTAANKVSANYGQFDAA